MTKNRVREVIDGDTFKVQEHGTSIRLNDVYAPELGDTGGQAAKQKLEGLIAGDLVTVKDVGEKDPYGRIVADVWNSSGDFVNDEMRKYLKR